MKLHKAIDRRLASQLVLLGFLTVLPVVMITFNGRKAVRAILAPVSTSADGPAAALEVPTGLNDPLTVVDKPSTTADRPAATAPLHFGVYDPDGVFATDKALKLRHIYISWAAFDPAALAEELRALEAQDFEILLTVEPWPAADASSPLLTGILNGEYDRILDELAGVLRRLDGPVYISWGHEMDQDLAVRYPWSNADPAQFVAAYRHVVDRLRERVDTPLVWIWAGVLKEGSLRYWPGEEYVDLIGMPVYSFPVWDQQTYGFIRDFRTTFEGKCKIVAELDKPLIITELGVSGSTDFGSFWLHQAFLALEDYPQLVGVIFFYGKDHAGVWGTGVETPDWRVHPATIRGLVDWKCTSIEPETEE